MSGAPWQTDQIGAPPTEFGGLPQPGSRWSTAVGVIGIVYGALALMCNCGSLFTVQFYQWMHDLAIEAGEADPAFEVEARVIESLQWLIIGSSLVAMAATIWLIVASTALIKRRHWSRHGLILWSIVELILLVVGLGLQAFVGQRTAEALAAEGLSAEVDEMWLWTIVGMLFTLVISAILPVFLLAWFSRSKIKIETAQWR